MGHLFAILEASQHDSSKDFTHLGVSFRMVQKAAALLSLHYKLRPWEWSPCHDPQETGQSEESWAEAGQGILVGVVREHRSASQEASPPEASTHARGGE